MTDIVERLRAQPHILGPLYAEAADEIERLRKVLKEIADFLAIRQHIGCDNRSARHSSRRRNNRRIK